MKLTPVRNSHKSYTCTLSQYRKGEHIPKNNLTTLLITKVRGTNTKKAEENVSFI